MIKRMWGITVAVVIAMFAATACSGSGGSGTNMQGTPPAGGGTLTVGSSEGIPQLNPAIRTFAWEEVLFPLLWDGLTEVKRDGSIGPDLATSWTQTDNAKTWTFHLRAGVKFSNGKAVTADDVVKTFRYYLNPKTATQEKPKIDVISKVQATNPSTVKFSLTSGAATFPAGIAMVKVMDMDALGQIDKKPIGTGPFTVSAFTPNQTVTLVRNPDYWGRKPSLDKIQIVKSPDATSAVTSLRSGDIDVLWNIPTTDAAELKGDSQLTVVTPKSPSVWADWELDTTAPPFNNVKAREALSYATDRKSILQDAYNGEGSVANTNDPLATNNPAYGGNLTDYSYNLAKAKQLFAEAGIHAGDTLTWWGVAGSYPEWSLEAQILQASLKKIGINLKIQNNDISTWAAKFYPAGKSYPGLIVPNLVNFPADPAYAIDFLLHGRCECNWNDPAFQSAYSAANGETDASARAAKWHQVQQIVSEQVPVVIPLQIATIAATSSKVSGVWLESGGQPHVEFASIK